MEFDVVIPIAPNDTSALKRNLSYIKENLSASDIVIVANESVKKEFEMYSFVRFVDENNIIPGLNYANVKNCIEKRYPKAIRRTGWYFQQFLKLAYSAVCEKKYYMTWDSDTIPVRKVEMFNIDEKPYFDVVPPVKEDYAYSQTISRLWSGKTLKYNDDFSFVTEHMIFDVDIVKTMINDIENNQSIEGAFFWEKILNAVSLKELNLSGFCEFETYSTYVRNYYENNYVIRQWHNLRHGRTYFGDSISWDQLKWLSDDFDAVSIEDFDQQLALCKIMCKDNMTSRVSFRKIYNLIEPMVKCGYKVRMFVRKCVRR